MYVIADVFQLPVRLPAEADSAALGAALQAAAVHAGTSVRDFISASQPPMQAEVRSSRVYAPGRVTVYHEISHCLKQQGCAACCNCLCIGSRPAAVDNWPCFDASMYSYKQRNGCPVSLVLYAEYISYCTYLVSPNKWHYCMLSNDFPISIGVHDYRVISTLQGSYPPCAAM